MTTREPGLFEIKDKDLAGRIGRLHTPHGLIETPALLPVIDPLRQELPVDRIRSIGFNAVITNAYLLLKRLGRNITKNVHEILGFDGVVMTDSGAYQILEYGRVDVSPDEIIEFEKRIGSDIAVILDIPTGNAKSYSQALYSVEETLRRANEAAAIIDADKRVWTLPIQGGQYIELLERSAKRSARLLNKYQLAALGSPTVLLERYRYSTLLDMVYTVRRIIPWSKPLHLFGAGHPMIIPYAVALGVDMFDSASYILYARDNRIMTRTRTYRLEDLEYMPCSTPVCVKYEPRELLEMPRSERVKLLAEHNLYVLREVLNEVKQAIREGKLWELLEERSRGHPSLAEAMKAVSERYTGYLIAHNPRVKASARGIFIHGPESCSHPRIVQHNIMLLARYQPQKRAGTLIPVHHEVKPLTHSKIYRWAKDRWRDRHVLGYAPCIGVIPEELAETYPLSQFEYNTLLHHDTVMKTIERIKQYLKRHQYDEVVLVYCDKHWSEKLADILAGENLERPRLALEKVSADLCS